MSPSIATLICVAGIAGLYYLDRDREIHTSRALWLPVIWLGVAGSRSVSEWFGILGFGGFGQSMNSAGAYLEGSPLDRNFFLALTLIGVVVLSKKKVVVKRLLRANWPVVLFFVYCAISTVWSDYPDVAFKRWLKAIGDLVMVLIVLSEDDPLSAIKRLVLRVGYLLLPLSVLFIKYYPAWGREYSHFDGRGTFTGVTTNKNILGMICLIFGLGALWCFRQTLLEPGIRRKAHLIAQGTLFGTAIWLFVMADSATSLSCFLMAAGLLVVTSLGRLGESRLWYTSLF